VKISARSVYFRRDGVSGEDVREAGEVEGWAEEENVPGRWKGEGRADGGAVDGADTRGNAEETGTASRVQAILRTTQPLDGRTDCVGAQSRATRVEEGGKRLRNYPIQRTYPKPPFPRCCLSLSPAFLSLPVSFSLSSAARARIKPDTS